MASFVRCLTESSTLMTGWCPAALYTILSLMTVDSRRLGARLAQWYSARLQI